MSTPAARNARGPKDPKILRKSSRASALARCCRRSCSPPAVGGSGRWQKYVLALRFKDRTGADFVLAPTSRRCMSGSCVCERAARIGSCRSISFNPRQVPRRVGDATLAGSCAVRVHHEGGYSFHASVEERIASTAMYDSYQALFSSAAVGFSAPGRSRYRRVARQHEPRFSVLADSVEDSSFPAITATTRRTWRRPSGAPAAKDHRLASRRLTVDRHADTWSSPT